ncbi:MAG: CFI-box-CTERM domain-containing protein [Chloroflexota bacterium]
MRKFREKYLLANALGCLLKLYYNLSPPMVEFITEHPSLKPMVKAGLLPVVIMSTISVNPNIA